jgi:GH35 family endo-1,4-beta-xylanase
MRKSAWPLMFILLFTLSLCAEEDDYHKALRTQLETDYNISGGDWVLGDNENSTNGKIQLTNVTRKLLDAGDELPFAKTVQLNIAKRGANGWDNAVRFPTSADIKEGDALLLVIWLNTVEADEGTSNKINFKFELSQSPYTQSLNFGATIKPGWRMWMLPFDSDIDYPAAGARFQMDMGHMAGVIEAGGIAVINYGTAYSVDELPMSDHHFDYDGSEPDAPWRTEALLRIDDIRKGDLKVKVVNKNGDAIKNAKVTVDMKKHEFGFGTAINANWWVRNTADAKTYLSKLEDLTGDGRTFNIAVFENALKWRGWEGTSISKDKKAEIVDWLKEAGMRVRGHNLVWPRWSSLPDDIEEHKDDPDYVKNRIQEHIADCAGYDGLKGRIDEWDVINEMVHCTDLRDVFGTEDIYTDWLNWAYEADPNAILYLNEYSIINGGGNDINSQTRFKEIIQLVLDQGAPLKGIGIQGHMGSSLTPPAKIIEILDDFGQYGLDMSVTEYDAKDLRGQIQADYMRDMLIACFSQPQMRNFLMWGFWDGSHWHEDAPIFDDDWSLKPSGEAFIEWVFEKWWTNESGLTTRDGQFHASAFYGEYDIAAEFDGQKTTSTIFFSKDSDELVLQLDTAETSVGSNTSIPTEFELAGNYPNPFNPSTTVRYALPRHSHVEISVFDVQGRLISTLVDETQEIGWHTVEFDGSEIASGTYLVRMTAGDFDATRKMLFVK